MEDRERKDILRAHYEFVLGIAHRWHNLDGEEKKAALERIGESCRTVISRLDVEEVVVKSGVISKEEVRVQSGFEEEYDEDNDDEEEEEDVVVEDTPKKRRSRRKTADKVSE